jgi:hypothetical protein
VSLPAREPRDGPYRVPGTSRADDQRREALVDELRSARRQSQRLLQAVGAVSIFACVRGPIVDWLPLELRKAGGALWLTLLLAWLISLGERAWIGRDLRRAVRRP